MGHWDDRGTGLSIPFVMAPNCTIWQFHPYSFKPLNLSLTLGGLKSADKA